jgi:hypothetical protein
MSSQLQDQTDFFPVEGTSLHFLIDLFHSKVLNCWYVGKTQHKTLYYVINIFLYVAAVFDNEKGKFSTVCKFVFKKTED